MEKTNKINLAERAEAHEAKLAEAKKQSAIEFVEKSAIPYLIDLANKGRRNTDAGNINCLESCNKNRILSGTCSCCN